MNKFEEMVKRANGNIAHSAFDWATEQAEIIEKAFSEALESWISGAIHDARTVGDDTMLNPACFSMPAGKMMENSNKYLITALAQSGIIYDRESNTFGIIC